MDASFRESSPGWLISKLLRRSWEAVEYWMNQVDWPDPPDLPEWSLPQWLLDFFGILGALTAQQFIILGLILLIPLLMLMGWGWARGDRSVSPSAILDPVDVSGLSGSAASWLETARREQQSQCYGKACQALYFAMLLKLDEAEIVPHLPSRTDGEYRYLTQDLPQPTAPQLLLETHERLYFGAVPASQELFEQCLQAYEQLAQQVEQQLAQKVNQQRAMAQAADLAGEGS